MAGPSTWLALPFLRIFTRFVARHPGYPRSAPAQRLLGQVERATSRLQEIRSDWLEAFIDDAVMRDMAGDPCDAAPVVAASGEQALVPGFTASEAGSVPGAVTAAAAAAAAMAPAAAYVVAPPPEQWSSASVSGPVGDEEWKAALAALSLPGSHSERATTPASGPDDGGVPGYLRGDAPRAESRPPASSAPLEAGGGRSMPGFSGLAAGGSRAGEKQAGPGFRGPGIGDPNDGTMGWRAGFEGGRGLTTLLSGGQLKNVLGLPTSDLGRIRNLYIPAGIVDAFLRIAAPNSARGPRGIETCGILAGRLMPGGQVTMTTLIVADQVGESDSCELTEAGEMQVFEVCSAVDADGSGLLQMGWIHTHPSQECFLSAYDVRTHLGFQAMFPEAVAIVAAPSDTRLGFGVFRLIEPGGVDIVKARRTNGHVPVPDGVFIYETTSHVKMVRGRAGTRPAGGRPGGRGAGGVPLDAEDFAVIDTRTTR